MLLVRKVTRVCMWVSALGALLSIGAWVASECITLDLVCGPTSYFYLGQGYVCWWGHDFGVTCGLHVRAADHAINFGDDEMPWYGIDVLGMRYAEVPLWWPSVVSVALATPALFADWVLARRAKRKGLCPQCGYDLTGNVTGICSECGRSVVGLPHGLPGGC